MTDLTPEELEEIERKVARFRDLVTNAAIRRSEKADGTKNLIARRQARELLMLPETKLRVLQQVIAGVTYKELANEYKFSVYLMRNYLRDIVVDQMPRPLDWDDDNNEWGRMWRASPTEFRTVWCPLTLKRLTDGGQNGRL